MPENGKQDINGNFDDQAGAHTIQPPRDDTADDSHGMRVEDPYRPLEDLDDPATLQWAEAQSNHVETFLKQNRTARERAYQRLEQIYNYARESLPTRFGSHHFSTYDDGVSAQPVYRVYDNGFDTPRILIDPNAWSEDGTIALGTTAPSDDGRYVVYGYSDGGADAQTLKICNVASGEGLNDEIGPARVAGVCWLAGRNDAFYYTQFIGGEDKDDLPKREVTKYHEIGQDPDLDPVVYDLETELSMTGIDILPDGLYEYLVSGIGTDKNNGLALRRAGTAEQFITVLDPQVAELTPFAEKNGKIYAITTYEAQMGRVVVIDPDNPAPSQWEEIVPETHEDRLSEGFIADDRLFLNYLHDCAEDLRVHDLDGTYQHSVPIPKQSVVATGKVDPEDTGFYLKISGLTQPGTQYYYDIRQQDLQMTKDHECVEDLEDCVIERLYAPSKDGTTQVPMTVIRQPDTKLDGTAAVKMFGYGGFNVPVTPNFSPGIVNWVREGGIFVTTNLRGGGEYGSEWYDAGRLDNKQNVFDDFIVCAEHLIDNAYTSPDRLLISGGSNGGLLTAACMLQRPELFGAVECDVPVLDMARFHLHSIGAACAAIFPDTQCQ